MKKKIREEEICKQAHFALSLASDFMEKVLLIKLSRCQRETDRGREKAAGERATDKVSVLAWLNYNHRAAPSY